MRRYRVFALAFAAMIGIYLLMNQWVSGMIYPAPSIPVSTAPSPLKELTVDVDGNILVGWLYDAPQQTHPVMLLYFHGNGENLQTLHLSGLFEELLKLNVSFFAIDYPGYGRSSGRASEANLLKASSAAIMHLKRTYPEHRINLVGWSLGASVAILSAAAHPSEVTALIALSPWASLPEVAKIHFPGWFVGLLLREQYDSLQVSRSIQCPSLVIHGERDRLIPVSQGNRIAEGLGRQCRRLLLPDAEHNDLLSHPDVWKSIRTFLKEQA